MPENSGPTIWVEFQEPVFLLVVGADVEYCFSVYVIVVSVSRKEGMGLVFLTFGAIYLLQLFKINLHLPAIRS